MTAPVRHLLRYCRKHKVLVTIVVVLFMAGLLRYLWKMGDFEVYFAAGTRFLLGARIHPTEVNAFTYPTAAALLFTPLALLGHAVAKCLFYTISFVMLLVGIGITNRCVLGPSGETGRVRMLVCFVAVLFSLRYFLAAFANQQTDLIIFGLVNVGIYLYQVNSNKTFIAWSFPVILKANPLFMILWPIYEGRWRVASGILILVAVMIFLPDLLRYLIEPGDLSAQLILPASVMAREGGIGQKIFVLIPIADVPFTYFREYVSLTFSSTGHSWWEDSGNPLGQSLTRILLFLVPVKLNGNVVFLLLCVVFSVALLVLVRQASGYGNLFIIGILFYSAFVLIGPHSSKPHFIVIYGLLLYCFQHLAKNFKIARLLFLCVIGTLLGFTSSGFLGEYANQTALYGHIGLATLALWVYTYVLVLNERDCRKDKPLK